MDDILNLISDAPYDINTVKALEEHVNSQSVGRIKYNADVMKGLLKAYQVLPEISNVDLVGNVLILSLMELPTTNYLALSYIVSPKLWSNPRLAVIKSCANFLERAQYTEFWSKYSDNTEVFDRVRGFVSSIRQFIAGSLRETCTSLSKQVFSQNLNLSADFDTFCREVNFIEVRI